MDYTQTRCWCFRVSNPNRGENEDGYNVNARALDPEGWKDMRYCIYQEEVGEEGTYHYQGYVEFNVKKRMSEVKLYDGLEGAWLGQRRGTQAEAIAYCKKKDDTYIDGPYEYGEFKLEPGKRNDLIKLKDDIKAGATMLELLENHTNACVMYPRGVQNLMDLLRPVKPRMSMHVVLCVGLTDTGKSHYCRTKAPEAYLKPKKAQWFPRYNGQKELIMDDFYGNMPWSDYLRYLMLDVIKWKRKVDTLIC